MIALCNTGLKTISDLALSNLYSAEGLFCWQIYDLRIGKGDLSEQTNVRSG
jgi:hypothetical protein